MSDPQSRVVEGWTGRLFEDFAVGDIYYHPFGKTVTEADNQMFTLMTQNVSKTHVDRNYAAGTSYKLPLVNSTFTLALVTGQSTMDLSMNVFANLGWDEVRMPAPVYEGDTIYSRSKVLDFANRRRAPLWALSRSRPRDLIRTGSSSSVSDARS